MNQNRLDNREIELFCNLSNKYFTSGVAAWLRRSVSNLVGFARVGSNPVVGTTNN